ncbi:MAG: 5-methyltetrahydrofolate--homocysteine methyltransferase, partial [Myxococcota bacterium]
MTDTRQALERLFAERIVIIDGAMGTAIQGYSLKEEDYRGQRYVEHEKPLFGCNDLLVHTRPDVVREIHVAYLEAGADIIETNTFNANAISMAEYGLVDEVIGLNRRAAELAKEATLATMAADPSRRCYVAGALGPTSTSASLSPDVSNPAYRAFGFDEIAKSYYDQVAGLMEGGVDLLLPETTFDTLNLKAALFAIEQYFRDTGTRVPVIASVTITDRSGRTLSGQTVEAFWHSISHADLTAVSMNCALGAQEMRPFLEALCAVAPIPVCCYPNAGLPNEMGEYDESPELMAAEIAEFARDGLLNGVGGCCGTRPDHIKAIADAMTEIAPREIPAIVALPTWTGLEPYSIYEGTTFTMIGERTNVAGSRKFRDLIRAGDFETAVSVARRQVDGGANILDVNMDEGLLDSVEVMTTFLNQLASEPDVSRLPIMIDSSKFEVIEAGLKCVQGKSIVNSISLKEGEEAFLKCADTARRFGASVIVMAFDEQGQATDVERRVAICGRAYDLLIEKVGFAPHDIIFDPNILAIGTGMEEHDNYGVTFIKAIPRIKERCPGALISGGISNLSFSFRGMNQIREAIHGVFLFHAIKAGMDMGIVNAGQLVVYDDIPADLLKLAEDLVLNRTDDVTDQLIAYGEKHKNVKGKGPERQAWRDDPLEERIKHALVKGIADHIEADMAEALLDPSYPKPLHIIEGPLMAGMSVVGDLFGAGKMFLPQVVKSARVMKKGVAHLLPYMEESGESASAGRIVMATVKGDVHDIGKNIVGVVLRCNGYEVVDLGVMVPADKILDKAIEVNAAAVGLSGLITPSLDEMVHVAKEMERRGMKTPLLIGGATTSKKHTAVKIAPAYQQTT